jgi:hypothetical protein
MQNKIWSAFWMFHNGIEIDMIDNGYSSNVNHNVFQNDLANQIFNSPCSPFFQSVTSVQRHKELTAIHQTLHAQVLPKIITIGIVCILQKDFMN